ncbi:unnamed protein product, partial [Ectocarpus fasciculatus]
EGDPTTILLCPPVGSCAVYAVICSWWLSNWLQGNNFDRAVAGHAVQKSSGCVMSTSRTHLLSCAHSWQCSPSMAFLCSDTSTLQHSLGCYSRPKLLGRGHVGYSCILGKME